MSWKVWRAGAMALWLATSHVAFSAVTPAATKGLVAHYCFEDQANLAKDCKGLNNGSVSGGSLRTSPGWRGQGARLDTLPGQTALFTVPNCSRLQFKDGLTFMLAILPDPDSRNLMMSKGGVPPDFECLLRVPGGWQPPELGFWIDMQSVHTGESSTATGFFYGLLNVAPKCNAPYSLSAWPKFVDGHWTHVTITASVATGQVNIYLNGALRPDATRAGFTRAILDAMNATSLTVAQNLAGVIDEVKVFNRALSADEVKAGFLSAGLAQPMDALSDGQHIANVFELCLFAGACGRTDDRHGLAGIDLVAAAGTPVRAVCHGKIDGVRQPADPSLRLVRVRHSGDDCGPFSGTWAYYGHVDLADGLTKGSEVSKGQSVGVVSRWLDGGGEDQSRLHLAFNSLAAMSDWGLVDTGVVTSECCTKNGVLPRRAALMTQGWMDPADLGAENGWLTILRTSKYDAPQDHVQLPYGKNTTYAPYFELP